MGRPIVSMQFRKAFQEFCVGLYLRQIATLFEGAGLERAPVPEKTLTYMSGQRRTLVEEYYSGIDWSDRRQTERFLDVVGAVLAQSYVTLEGRTRLLKLCADEGLIVEGHHVRFPEAPVGHWLLGSDAAFERAHFEVYIERLAKGSRDDPEAAIGYAKELLEVTAKYVLTELGQPVTYPTVPTLLKAASSALGLTAEDIPEAAKGAEIARRVLGALGQVTVGMAELRNLYGIGHGRLRRSGAIKTRHAKLAVGASVTLFTFLLETLDERKHAAKPPADSAKT